MSIHFVSAAFRADVKTPALKLVLIKLGDNASDSGYCWPSMRRIAAECCISLRTARRAVADLKAMGWITVTDRMRPDGSSASSLFLVHPERFTYLKLTRDPLPKAAFEPPPDDDEGVTECHYPRPPRPGDPATVTAHEPSIEPSVNTACTSSLRSEVQAPPSRTETPEGGRTAAGSPTAEHASAARQASSTAKAVNGKAEASYFDTIVEAYHRLLPDNPRVAILTDKRRGQIRARCRDTFADLAGWERYFRTVAESDFLTGRRSRGVPFRANFDWLLNLNNLVKVAEGCYDNCRERP